MPIHKGLHGAKFVVSLFLIVLFAYVIVYADTFFTGDEVTVINPIFTEASTNDLASINVNTIIVNDWTQDNRGVIQYIVQAGDTLGGIASKFGTTISHLKKINAIGHSPMRGWQKLIVTDEQEWFVYTLQENTTIGVFADTYGLNKEDLMSLNYMQDETELLTAWQELFINLSTEQAYQANLLERPKPRPIVAQRPTIIKSSSSSKKTPSKTSQKSPTRSSVAPSSSRNNDIISQWTYNETIFNGFYAWTCTRYMAITTPAIFGPVKDGKQNRPFWWDARTWYANAKKAGFSVGQTPRVGSIVVYSALRSSAGHVGKVTKYLPDEWKMIIRDMNYAGKFIVTDRREDSNNDKIIWYIYP